MKTKLLFLIFTFSAICSFGQELQKISGVALSKDSTLIDGYNLVLLSAKDSSVYKGNFLFDPNFSIETSRLPVLLSITSFGYRDTIILITSAPIQLDTIRLSPVSYEIKEVVLRASKPMFSIKEDRITLNVEGTLLSESGTVADILQKAPRVKVDEKGVSVPGAGVALIIVDGRELPNQQALSMSSSEIEKIDVITNPSSKYDAKGKAVIKISSKKAKYYGFGGGLISRINKGEYWNPYIGTYLFSNHSKLSLYGSYSFTPNKRFVTESYDRDYTHEVPPIYGIIDVASINNTKENHQARVSADYRFSKKHQAGLQFSAQFRDGNNNKKELSKTNTYLDGNILSQLSSTQNIPFTNRFLAGTAYYTFQSAPKGINVNVVFDKLIYDANSDAHITEQGGTALINKQNNNKNRMDITSLKADAVIPLPKDYKLETGFKYSNVNNVSNTRFTTSDIVVRNVDYHYKENIGAIYFLVSKQFKKLRAEAGVRIEISDNYATTDIIVQDTTQWNLFPSVNLSYKLAKNWDMGFSYTTKITRPTFQDLNPAIDYVDELTYFQGNPHLISETRHSLNLKVTYRKFISLGFNYTRGNNLLSAYVEQDPTNPKITRVTQKNIDKADLFSIDLVVPYQNKWLSCYLATGLKSTISNDASSTVMNLKQPMWYAYSGFDFTLPYGFKLSTNIRYFTKGLENIWQFDPVFRMDAAVSKSLLKDQLTISFMWNDIFKTDGMNTYTTINNRYIGYQYYFDRSIMTLSLAYRFNVQKNKYKSRSSISSQSRRIKGVN